MAVSAAPGAAAHGANTGAIYRFTGPFSGAYTEADATTEWVGVAAGAWSGYRLKSGDVTGDGVADVVDGATDDGTVYANAGGGTLERPGRGTRQCD